MTIYVTFYEKELNKYGPKYITWKPTFKITIHISHILTDNVRNRLLQVLQKQPVLLPRQARECRQHVLRHKRLAQHARQRHQPRGEQIVAVHSAQLYVQHHIAQQHQRFGAHLLGESLSLVGVECDREQLTCANAGARPVGAVLQQHGAQHLQQTGGHINGRTV